MKGMKQNTQALLYGGSAVLLWSTVATAFTIALRYITPAQLLFLATITSFLFLFCLIVIKKQVSLFTYYAKTHWKGSFFFGAINPFLYYLILFAAYDVLPAQEAQAINYTWAIMLSLLAIPILGQKLTGYDVFSALLCYFGVLFIATHGRILSLEFSNLQGVLMALLSTIIWALYWLLNTKDTRPSLIGLALNFMFSIPIISLYCWITGAFSVLPLEGVVSAVYIGLFEMGLAFVLWNQALKLTNKAGRIANLIFISPFLSAFWLFYFASEEIQLSTVLGFGFILFGLIVQNYKASS